MALVQFVFFCRKLSIYQPIYCNSSMRYFSFKIEKLKSRCLLQVSGENVFSFMQGLITNDISYLDNAKSIYSMFLNQKGRVLYDSILYKQDDNSLLIECDCKIQNDLANHLKLFRVRRKINIEPSNMQLWVIFNETDASTLLTSYDDSMSIDNILCRGMQVQEDANHADYLKELLKEEKIKLYNDPRLYLLGTRVIVPENMDTEKKFQHFGIEPINNGYVTLRYKLGIGEGISELPPGDCFPLEMNCDYLHGVSFHKGCYIGQELTARVHHTGVVRKRLMPLILKKMPSVDLSQNTVIEAAGNSKSLGKLRGLNGIFGIALLRINECLQSSSQLMINDIPIFTYMPPWWPHKFKVEKDSTLSSEK